MMWGAGLACALGGAVAGTALGSTPVLDRPTIGAFYQSHDQAAGSLAAEERVLPDHYPLVTRNGTVSVAELADRGLYSQRRYRAVFYAVDSGPGYAPASYEPDQPRYTDEDPALRVGDAADARPNSQWVERDAAPEPLQLAAGPATIAASGQAKTVNVEAALAMR